MAVVVFVLLLLSSPNFAQDANNEKSECEEAWKYVEFLKMDVTEPVNTILQETLYDAKLKPSEEGLEETLEVSMKQLMDVRASLLERIKNIRKGEEEVCPNQGVRQEKGLSSIRKGVMELLLKIIDGTPATLDKIKLISKEILRLKLVVQNEVMRLLMLPAPGSTTVVVSSGDCEDCQGLQTIAAQLTTLLECAGEEPIEDIDIPVGGSPVVERPTARSAECPPPQMFSMQLISVNERIDNEIKTLYNLLVIEIEDEARSKHIAKLDFFKTVRASIEEVITNLMKEDEDDQLKRVVVRGVVLIIRTVTLELKKCGAGCGPPCDSCGGEVVRDGLAKLEEYRELLDQGGDEGSREFIRDDLISFIQGNNREGRDILIRKANGEDLEKCEKEKLEVFGETKGPYWMLVNATIFTPSSGEIVVIVSTMEEVLKMKLEDYCGKSGGSTRIPSEGNCKWDEYEATKLYLEQLDLIIQENLFKANDEEDKMKALLGFVDLQGMLDKRVKALFQNKLACPEEVDVIKKQYMDRVNQCMAQMMNPRIQFEKMSRRARIECTKELRTIVEERIQTLLEDELEESLNHLGGDPDLPPFLTNPDSPIEDIDLPVNGPGVLRPGVSRAANFLCKDQLTLISIDKRCNGVNDCPQTETLSGGEDEEGCEGSGQVA